MINKKRIIVLILLIIFFVCIPIKSYALTIVIDPGHGGIDSGASGNGLQEKNLTLRISQYLRDYLQTYSNVNVYLTHEGLNNTSLSLKDRADFARNKKADLFISIHVNSVISPNANGAEAYVSYRTELPKYNEQMTILGNKILNNLSNIGFTNNGVKTRIAKNNNNDPEYKYYDGSNGDYYGIIRRAMKGGYEKTLGPNFSDGSGISTILVEHGYITNSSDVTLLDSEEDLSKIAKADCDAIAEFFGLEQINIKDYLFDAKFYYYRYKDLQDAFGYNERLLRNHYYTYGIKEGRSASVAFDPKVYLNKYADLQRAFGANNYEAAYYHFINNGAKEGRLSSKFYNGKYYLNNYTDLQRAFKDDYKKAFRHFVLNGINENRIAIEDFNIKDFKSNCTIYQKNILGNDNTKYYVFALSGKIVDPPINIKDYLFDANYYYNKYIDLQRAIGFNEEALRNHYYEFGIKEGRSASAVFNPKYYMEQYSDLRKAFGANNYEAAYYHFINNGINEGRNSSESFNVKTYINNYTDLQNTFGQNYSKALQHYCINGIREGRNAK